ncbi:hypothetical protein C476_16565 [Natrinema limicola JCM 13563]|uniref:Uncharacterized protein n=1 Tax=Natrinema limicola JCM 13563 TaxID=1230457 RepID=M0C2S2_9EURY|nr:hypothetical protein C476_16565 [Natrinema limicola JCM 13563]
MLRQHDICSVFAQFLIEALADPYVFIRDLSKYTPKLFGRRRCKESIQRLITADGFDITASQHGCDDMLTRHCLIRTATLATDIASLREYHLNIVWTAPWNSCLESIVYVLELSHRSTFVVAASSLITAWLGYLPKRPEID